MARGGGTKRKRSTGNSGTVRPARDLAGDVVEAASRRYPRVPSCVRRDRSVECASAQSSATLSVMAATATEEDEGGPGCRT